MQAEEYAVFITPNYWMVQLSNIFLLEQRAANLSATDIKQHELKKKKQVNLALILITLLMMIIVKTDY